VLGDLYALATQHGGRQHGHAAAALEVMHPGARHELGELESRGWAHRTGADEWAITPEGAREAERRTGGGEEVDG
jgi:Mn-dependent DtxR family transcriptional regulator